MVYTVQNSLGGLTRYTRFKIAYAVQLGLRGSKLSRRFKLVYAVQNCLGGSTWPTRLNLVYEVQLGLHGSK